MDPTIVRLRTCFSIVFPDLKDQETFEASVENTPEWDSLATVKLSTLIEEEFGIALDLDDFEETMSFHSLLKRIQGSATGA